MHLSLLFCCLRISKSGSVLSFSSLRAFPSVTAWRDRTDVSLQQGIVGNAALVPVINTEAWKYQKFRNKKLYFCQTFVKKKKTFILNINVLVFLFSKMSPVLTLRPPVIQTHIYPVPHGTLMLVM